jgi:hypothetical protein
MDRSWPEGMDPYGPQCNLYAPGRKISAYVGLIRPICEARNPERAPGKTPRCSFAAVLSYPRGSRASPPACAMAASRCLVAPVVPVREEEIPTDNPFKGSRKIPRCAASRGIHGPEAAA